ERRRSRVLGWLGVVPLVFAALLGSNVWSLRDRVFGSAIPAAAPVATSRNPFAVAISNAPAPRTSLRSVAWWQTVQVLHGTGTQPRGATTCAPGGIQGRLRSACTTGRIVVRSTADPSALIDAACPAGARAISTRPGPVRLQVTATGAWTLRLDQE